jgi:hypothetical protein
LTGRIFLANVGANASHRFSSPVFEDGKFEFITIPEDRDLDGPHAVRFKDIRSFYDPERRLMDYIPERLWEWPSHHDPEFETFTYGDNCEINPRAASLKRMETGDFLFFLVRLNRWVDGKPTKDYGFYLVGFLEIAGILRDVRNRPSDKELRVYRKNAHVIRGLSDESLWDRFWVFKGSKNSRRFHKAVPVTKAIASKVFRTADDSPWQWDGRRSDLQVIGSYTRSCRCVIDPSKPGHAERAKEFWEWVEIHSK